MLKAQGQGKEIEDRGAVREDLDWTEGRTN